MMAKPELQRKWMDVYYDREGREFPKWRITEDKACGVLGALACRLGLDGCNCPHWPFNFQIETDDGDPRGQINFFYPSDYVPVNRSYYVGVGQEMCHSEEKWVPDDEVCEEGRYCECGTDGGCPLETPPPGRCRVNQFKDERLTPPESYSRGPAGQLTILEPDHRLLFEMDQDYHVVHDSAPVCEKGDYRYAYSRKYMDPDWNWLPSDCKKAHEPGAPFTLDSIESTPIRAVHTLELRARVDGLRRRFGLTAFAWTDATIHFLTTPVRVVHMTELRTALNEAHVAAGRGVPTYTDPTIVANVTLIRAVHLTELRAAVVALEE